MTDTATAEAAGTVPAIPMISVNHNLAIAGNLADVEITISGKDIPVRNAQGLVEDLQKRGIALLQGQIIPRGSLTGSWNSFENFKGELWPDQEKQPLIDTPDMEAGIAAYRTAFPKSRRTRNAIKRQWSRLHPKGAVPVREDPPGNDISPGVRPVELNVSQPVVLATGGEQMAHTSEPAKVQGSMAPGKSAPKFKNGHGRDLTCPFCQKIVNSLGMHMHVKGTHPEHFLEWLKNPDRLGHDVHDKPILITNKPKKAGKGNANKWDIPFNSSTEPGKYQAAYQLCRWYNLPYPGALKKHEDEKKAKKKAIDTKTESPATLRNDAPVPKDIPGKKISEKTVPTIDEQPRFYGEVPVIVHVGQGLRHNGDKSSPFFGKTGECIKVAGTQVLMEFGNSRSWMSKDLLLTVSEKEAAAACPTS